MKHHSFNALHLGLLSAIVACSSAGDVVLGRGQLKGTGGAEAVASTGNGPSGGASSGGSETGGTLISPQASTGGSGGGDCFGVVQTAESILTDVYVMFDQSGSMNEPIAPPSTGTWWSAAQQAFEAFVSDPVHSGVAVGLQFFPLDGVAPASCRADYATPEVPVDLLQENAAALVSAIQAHQPTGFTPSGPALAGAIAHMKARGNGLTHSVVLVTDGFPTECEPLQISGLAEIARRGYESEPQVRTFVVGMNLGPSGQNLNSIAEAGGTEKAFLVGAADVGAALEAAMQGIIRQPLACRIQLPSPADGARLDLTKINLSYTPPSGAEETLFIVDAKEGCEGLQNLAWYFEASGTPERVDVVLCPQTCNRVQTGRLSVVFGCPR